MNKFIKPSCLALLLLGIGAFAQEQGDFRLSPSSGLKIMRTEVIDKNQKSVLFHYNEANDDISGNPYTVIQDDVIVTMNTNSDGSYNIVLDFDIKPTANARNYQNIAVGLRLDDDKSKDIKADYVEATRNEVLLEVHRSNSWVEVNRFTTGKHKMGAYIDGVSKPVQDTQPIHFRYTFNNINFNDNISFFIATASANAYERLGTNQLDSNLANKTQQVSGHDEFGHLQIISKRDIDDALKRANQKDILDEYNISWKKQSVDNRNDVGYQWAPDGKSIVYYYDLDDDTVFNENELLKQLIATGKTQNTRNLDGTEKIQAENGQNGYYQDNNHNYYLNNNNIEILDIISEGSQGRNDYQQGWGGHDINTTSSSYFANTAWNPNGEAVQSVNIPAHNTSNAFNITTDPVGNADLIGSTLIHHQIYATSQSAHKYYDYPTRHSANNADVVNLYTIGYRKKAVEPAINVERHIFFIPRGVQLETPLQILAEDTTGVPVTITTGNLGGMGLSITKDGKISGKVPANYTVSWYSRKTTFSSSASGTIDYVNTDPDNKLVINVTEAVGGEDTHEYGDTFTIDQILALTTIKANKYADNATQAIKNAYEESNEWAPHSSYNDLSNVERYIAKKEFVDAQGNPLTQADVPTSGKGNEVYVKVYYKDTMNGNIIGSEIVKNIINYTMPICVKPANTNGLGEKTNFGITDLGRAGETPDAWPMLRKGGWIALESNDKGFVITRTTENQITNPQEGMLIYDTANHCLKLYDGTKWSCFSEPSCPTEPNN